MNIKEKIYRRIPNKIKKVIKKRNILDSKEKLIKKLMKYDVISFDIFDTLITRLLFDPDDIFEIVERRLVGIPLKESIYDMRKNAELEARKQLKKDVNIDEIYTMLGKLYNYDEKDINSIKWVEVDTELKLTYPRKDMLDVLKTLMDNGKKVILVSDMYLTIEIIKKMLDKCGYKEKIHYKKIFLSNEKNRRKDDESLWNYVRILYANLKFIHVGDNIHSDYNVPTKMGLKAINIDNPREALRKTKYCDGINYNLENRTIEDSLFLGYIFNAQIFNSPFSSSVDSLEKISKTFISPIIFDYLKFLNENSKEDDILLFLAREGYFLEKLYDEYCNIFSKHKNKSYYFLASRRAVISSTFEKVEDIEHALDRDYNGNLKNFIEKTFDIEYKDDNRDIKLPDDKDFVISKIKRYYDLIISKSLQYKDNYMSYISSLFDYKKDHYIIVDLGYSGTIQYHLSKMLNKDLKGLYLTNSDSVKKFTKDNILMFDFDINKNDLYKKIYHYSLILEYFLSAPYGQLQYFDNVKNKIQPVYNDELMDDLKKQNIHKIYDYVLESFKELRQLDDIIPLNVTKDLLCNNYISMVESNLISRDVKDLFIFMDSFCSDEPKNVFKIISRY